MLLSNYKLCPFIAFNLPKLKTHNYFIIEHHLSFLKIGIISSCYLNMYKVKVSVINHLYQRGGEGGRDCNCLIKGFWLLENYNTLFGSKSKLFMKHFISLWSFFEVFTLYSFWYACISFRYILNLCFKTQKLLYVARTI